MGGVLSMQQKSAGGGRDSGRGAGKCGSSDGGSKARNKLRA